MNWNVFTTVILLIANIVVLAYTVMYSRSTVDDLIYEEMEIPHFSVDVKFTEFPRKINISNTLECNANNVDKMVDCTMGEPVYGCRELAVRCHHFKDDTKVFRNGVEATIRKNTSEKDGYALAIPIIATCNTNHGRITLVTTSASSNEYMMICTCINPGYIGNDNLLGNCETVFICDGKIDSIEKELKDINCICEGSKFSTRYEDLSPVCQDVTVGDAVKNIENWNRFVPWNSVRRLPLNRFNKELQERLIGTSELLDPCRNSIHDTSIEIRNAYYDEVHGECHFVDYGYPVDLKDLNGQSRPLLERAKFKPFTEIGDDDKKVEVPDTHITAGLATGGYVRIRYTDRIAPNVYLTPDEDKNITKDQIVRKLTAIIVRHMPHYNLGWLKNTKFVLVAPPGTSFSQSSPIFITTTKEIKTKTVFIGPECVADYEVDWLGTPRYECYYSDVYTERTDGIPRGYSNGPNKVAFWWGTDYWDYVADAVNKAITYTDRGMLFNNKMLLRCKDVWFYGIQIASINFTNEESGFVVFRTKKDYLIHKNTVAI